MVRHPRPDLGGEAFGADLGQAELIEPDRDLLCAIGRQVREIICAWSPENCHAAEELERKICREPEV